MLAIAFKFLYEGLPRSTLLLCIVFAIYFRGCARCYFMLDYNTTFNCVPSKTMTRSSRPYFQWWENMPPHEKMTPNWTTATRTAPWWLHPWKAIRTLSLKSCWNLVKCCYNCREICALYDRCVRILCQCWMFKQLSVHNCPQCEGCA